MRATSLIGGGFLFVLTMAAIGLPGCRMIDQRTFEAQGQAPRPAQLAASGQDASALPLVTIRFPVLDPDWAARVLDAVHAAQARLPGVTFSLVTPVPLSASLDSQQRAVTSGAQDAQSVAAVLQGDGIDAAQIHLGSRGDLGQPAREVRIYAH